LRRRNLRAAESVGQTEVPDVRLSKSIALVVVLLFGLGGCASEPEPPPVVLIPVPTQPEPAPGVAFACMDALASGVLVADGRWGIALGQPDAPTVQVIWPTGYTGRQVHGSIQLLDAKGAVVGMVGDAVSIGGGMGAGNAWWACGAPMLQQR
jgi:hypothetical protein